MEAIFFILRYIPFWAVPLLLISGEFAYIYWLKSIRRTSKVFMVIGGVAGIFILYYYIAGGPEKSVQLFENLIHSLRD